METIFLINLVIFALAIIVMIGFIITWGIFKKKGHIRGIRISKRVILLTLPLIILLTISTISINNKLVKAAAEEQREEEEYEKQRAKKLKTAKTAFKYLYLAAWSKTEDIAQQEHKVWGQAIDNNVYSFDVDETLSNITDSQESDLSKLKDDVDSLEKLVSSIEDNSEYTSTDEAYEKAHSALKKFYRFVESPGGSYLSFSTKYSELDDATEEAYDALKSLEH